MPLLPPRRPCCSKLYLLWCRMLSSERQYVAVLKGVEETYLPLLELSDTPASVRDKAEALFPNWAGLSNFHSQHLLPAMEGALVQSLLQQDCFSKYVRTRVAKFSSSPQLPVLWSLPPSRRCGSNCRKPSTKTKESRETSCYSPRQTSIQPLCPFKGFKAGPAGAGCP